jgi:hypothetical protein
MSPFSFDFDLEDDLDQSFDAIPPKPSILPIDAVPAPDGTDQPSDEIPKEIPLSKLVRPSYIASMVTTASRSTAFRAP